MKYPVLKLIFPFAVLLLLLNGCVDDNAADPDIPGSDRDKYLGAWICKEAVQGNAPNTFTIQIQKHGNDDTLHVYNFNNVGAPDYAVWIISGNSITIPAQTITQIDISGSGFFNDDKLILNYTSDAEQVSATCTH